LVDLSPIAVYRGFIKRVEKVRTKAGFQVIFGLHRANSPPTTGQAFLAYVEQVLLPTLKPDEIVAMDNLPASIIHNSPLGQNQKCNVGE
jgi:hypothetical protein